MIEDNLLPSESKNVKSLSKFSKSDKRCMELDEEYNSLQNHSASVLSFDAYGNLTSNNDPNVSFSHDLPSMEEFDFIIEGFEASFRPQPSENVKSEESVAVIKKPNSSKISQSVSPFESPISHDNLKQAFKPEVNPITAATSRYGRTRKQKVVGEDFLVGTINFNELQKITSPTRKRDYLENKSESEAIVNSIDTKITSRKNKHNLKNRSGSVANTTPLKIIGHNSKTESDSEVNFNSLESTRDSWQTIPKFEVIADSIPNFSSEDEFEPEKVNLNDMKFKKHTKKQLQSHPIDSEKMNKVKPDANNKVQKQISKVDEKKSPKIKKRKHEENCYVRKETTIIKENDDSPKVERRESPRQKRKCEDLEPVYTRNTRRNNSTSLISEKEDDCITIIEKKEKESNNLCNNVDLIDMLDYSKAAITNLSESIQNNNLGSYTSSCLNKFEAVNSVSDIEQDVEIIKCSLNDSDKGKGSGTIPPVKDFSKQIRLHSEISCNDSTKGQTSNAESDTRLEIIKMETLFDETEVKGSESLSVNKVGQPVKCGLIDKSPKEKVDTSHKMDSDISIHKEDSLIMSNIDEKEVENILPYEYKVGDLVWVGVGASYLWPGLITNSKDSSNYTKLVTKNGIRVYHIQFLCDNYQVTWSKSTAIIPFEGLPKLVKYMDKFCKEFKKHPQSFGVPRKCIFKTLYILKSKTLCPKSSRWHEAITTGEAYSSLRRDERLQKFMTEEEEELKKKKKSKTPKKLETNNNNNDSRKLLEDEFSGFENGSSVEDMKIKRQKLSDKLNDVDFDVYFKKHFHRLLKKNPDISKKKARKILLCRWNNLTVSQQAKYKILNMEKFLSLSSSESSISESSSQTSTKVKRSTVNEKNHEESSKGTYKLIRNEKVCFLCESVSLLAGGGDMVKCKGPCCGTFHMQCVLLDKNFVGDFKCSTCLSGVHECFICKLNDGEKLKCSMNSCGKFFHESCVKTWPQINKGRHTEKLICPRHLCHMCAANADDMNDAAAKTGPFTRCLRCPTTYHTGEVCIAAGSEEISQGYHICTKHMKIPKNNTHHLNVNWCFCCSKGGSLLLCDQCPAAFHAECMNITAPEGSYICEDCENGKFPVYGDIVWVKLGQFRWWPGQVLHPRNIPDNIENLSHVQGMFCVHFFGSDDYYWVSRGRAFHYQEGDQGCSKSGSKLIEQKFQLALDIALKEYVKQNEKRKQQEESRSLKNKVKPAPWVKIDTNKPVGNVKLSKFDPSTATKCDCDPYAEAPCGSDEKCINRMLMVECIKDVCPAGDRCQNQRFQKRQYPNVYPFKTSERGWGLRTKDLIKKGDFVIEYVGELIDDAEFRRRIVEMHECKEENYYFLTVETDRMIDAGPKGNLARFMNHSCEPNCETQKWTVGDETRVGLFALDDISPDSEVTFNYNLECVGTDKKPCHCGASRCSGFIGVKVQKSGVKKLKLEKKKTKRKSKLKDSENECFRCGNPGDLILCDRNTCPKGYHLECLSLPSLPKGKWWCPWHHCDDCGSKSVSSCIMCPNSYCKAHSSNKFYSTGGLENVCLEHAEDEFEALRGQRETATVRDQKNPLENKVQKRSHDNRNKRSPEQLQSLPATSEFTKKERGFKSPIKSESLEHKQQKRSPERRGRKRKNPQTENFSSSLVKLESKKIKLSAKAETETKKRILKTLTNNVVTPEVKKKCLARISPKKVNATVTEIEPPIVTKSSSTLRSSTGLDNS